MEGNPLWGSSGISAMTEQFNKIIKRTGKTSGMKNFPSISKPFKVITTRAD